MYAEIVTIGDEILIGQIVDTNSAFIATELHKIGVSVYQITSVQDQREHILKALEEAESRADLVLLTGGLGPTKDDITKHTLCEYLEDTLVQDARVLAHVEELFRTYISTPISDLNRKQALVPSRAQVLHNAHGTAPGLWMQGRKAVLVSLPGVPFEMKELLGREVLPRIARSFTRPVLLHRTLITYGLGESAIAERIAAWEDALPPHMKLAYLPNLGKVRLRLSAKGTDLAGLQTEMEERLGELRSLIADILVSEEDGELLESVLQKRFTEKGATLATAESFTGGKLAAQLTSVPGASAYFKGSVVSYATSVKASVLGVPEALIREHSVVSGPVAEAMAQGVRQLLGTDFALATTGNAGPTKGDSDAPIGTVYLAIAGPKGVYSASYTMGNHRERIVQKSVHKGFELLLQEILKF
ncbi:competence/damage-inducible protein A [Robiginitalea sp. M366]|uniref:competence/damage-inducible protein A n=1 Tax=Robiginitalea aestuariiviva TaxID=3036903 RepID=UPI00240DE66F|nr:competence/damage-inducible protein A [Robiginitalea aestuariiviva]MDG1573210.1 competence/damage-inducible protein A [Robiginitalea aestuariiviva]